MTDRTITEVFDRHVEQLMAIKGVNGVALGKTDREIPCILVMVIEMSDQLRLNLPPELEGHPVRIIESGEIKPL